MQFTVVAVRIGGVFRDPVPGCRRVTGGGPNAAIQWNEAAARTAYATRDSDRRWLRAWAIVHTCMHDAWRLTMLGRFGTSLAECSTDQRPVELRRTAEAISFAAFAHLPTFSRRTRIRYSIR